MKDDRGFLVSKELKPLIIPSSFSGKQAREAYRPVALGEMGDVPPRVPPK